MFDAVSGVEISIGSGSHGADGAMGDGAVAEVVIVAFGVGMATGLIFNADAADEIADLTGLLFTGPLASAAPPAPPRSNVRTTPALPSSPSNIVRNVVDSHSERGTNFLRQTNVAPDPSWNTSVGSTSANRLTIS